VTRPTRMSTSRKSSNVIIGAAGYPGNCNCGIEGERDWEHFVDRLLGAAIGSTNFPARAPPQCGG
jgi:hypothetical protein